MKKTLRFLVIVLLGTPVFGVPLTLNTQGVTGTVETQLDWLPRHGVVAYVNGAPSSRLAQVTIGLDTVGIFAAFQLIEPAVPSEDPPTPGRWDILVDVAGDQVTPPQRSAIRQAIIDALAVAFPCPWPPWATEEPASCAPPVRNARKTGKIQARTLREADVVRQEAAAAAARAAADAAEQEP